MKNLFSMMLALAMALSLSACDGKDKESENPKPLEYIKIMSFNIVQEPAIEERLMLGITGSPVCMRCLIQSSPLL